MVEVAQVDKVSNMISGERLASMGLWIWSMAMTTLLDFERHRASSSDNMEAFKEKGGVDEMALSICLNGVGCDIGGGEAAIQFQATGLSV